MKYGFVIPGGDVLTIVQLAAEAEAAGWDGVFVPDCICIDPALAPDAPGFDPWVLMGAIAMRTKKVRIGAIITPLSRRRPWKVARETATLDRLSNGRLVLPVGLGALDDLGFGGVGEATDRKVRAELLDESLEIITGLWSGEPFSYSGKHYRVSNLTFLPRPVQLPRIPIWVVGAWPRAKSMNRALKYDGLLPNVLAEDGSPAPVTPEAIRAMRDYAGEHRSQPWPFDIIAEGKTPGDDRQRAADIVGPYAEAGATWWMEAIWDAPPGSNLVRDRINQGPPTLV
ncbi:MAG: LLM class flavin-dependent oxidoreductase, partial [Chloroflexota bacterium]|nr:LLM class flavin-dependent oxidoreductase [Chloroflexota bacterium]